MHRMLAEDLVVLLMGERNGREPLHALPHALGRALLVDLAMLGAVDLRRASLWRRAGVVPTATTPEDALLADSRRALGRGRASAAEAATALDRGLRASVVARMVGRRTLSRLTAQADGGEVVPLDPQRLVSLRRQVGDALATGRAGEPRTAALALLWHATGLEEQPASAEAVAALRAAHPALGWALD